MADPDPGVHVHSSRRVGVTSRLLVAATFALVASLLSAPGLANVEQYDQELQDAQSRAQQAQSTLDAISSQASSVRDELVALESRLADAEARLRTLDGQVALAAQELDEREEVAAAAAAQAAAAAEQLLRVEAELAGHERVLNDQLAAWWIHGSTSRPALLLELLRTSSSPSDLAADMYRIETVLDAQASTVTAVEQLRADQIVAVDEARSARLRAERLRQDAAQAVALVQGLRDQAADARASVAADRDRQSSILASLESDADQARAVLASVAAEQDRLEAERRAAAEERRRQQQSGGGGGSASGSGPCPVDGARAERDFTNDWGYPRPGGRSHEGNDIFADRGTPVRSVGSGTVKDLRRVDTGLGGLYVNIWTGSEEYWYFSHLDSIEPWVAPGVPVSDGQQIGTVGNSGNARGTPPHLHIGHYVNDMAHNPYPIIASRCP